MDVTKTERALRGFPRLRGASPACRVLLGVIGRLALDLGCRTGSAARFANHGPFARIRRTDTQTRRLPRYDGFADEVAVSNPLRGCEQDLRALVEARQPFVRIPVVTFYFGTGAGSVARDTPGVAIHWK